MLLLMVLSVASPVGAGTRIYDGEEAEALLCAHHVGATGEALYQAGLISELDSDRRRTWSLFMMQRYVSGTTRQKIRALQTIDQRMGYVRSTEENDAQMLGCINRFPL